MVVSKINFLRFAGKGTLAKGSLLTYFKYLINSSFYPGSGIGRRSRFRL